MTVPAIFYRSITRSMAVVAICLGAIAVWGAPVIAQDVAAGKRVFTKCVACHRVGPNAFNGVGPILNGLIGRKAGTLKGYDFPKANKSSGLTWDEKTFRRYIKKPRKVIPGTKMPFAGLKSEKQINDLVAYLKQFAADGKIKAK